MNVPISVTNLTKTFGRFQALDGFDLTVQPGKIHGFLGPNGAGKSTTIRILLGLLRRDDGDVQVLGGDPWADGLAIRRRLAYVPGDVTLWPTLSGGEAIDLLAGLSGPIDQARRTALIERFALDETKRCRSYSTGNRQKVVLIAAFLARAELLILDEPTSGLDPLMEATYRECVLEARDAGATVLLSSHILSEVEHLCDQVTIIRDGRTVESRSLADLRQLTSTRIAVDTRTPLGDLGSIDGIEEAEVDGTHADLVVNTTHLDTVIGYLHGRGVQALTASPPTLEELFMTHYDRSPSTASRKAAHDA